MHLRKATGIALSACKPLDALPCPTGCHERGFVHSRPPGYAAWLWDPLFCNARGAWAWADILRRCMGICCRLHCCPHAKVLCCGFDKWGAWVPRPCLSQGMYGPHKRMRHRCTLKSAVWPLKSCIVQPYWESEFAKPRILRVCVCGFMDLVQWHISQNLQVT